jgi:hypothetical protein
LVAILGFCWLNERPNTCGQCMITRKCYVSVNQITVGHLLEDVRTNRTSVRRISRRFEYFAYARCHRRRYIFLIKQLEMCEDTFTVRSSLLVRLIFSEKNGGIHRKRLSTKETAYLTVHLFCCEFSFLDVLLNREKV